MPLSPLLFETFITAVPLVLNSLKIQPTIGLHPPVVTKTEILSFMTGLLLKSLDPLSGFHLGHVYRQKQGIPHLA